MFTSWPRRQQWPSPNQLSVKRQTQSQTFHTHRKKLDRDRTSLLETSFLCVFMYVCLYVSLQVKDRTNHIICVVESVMMRLSKPAGHHQREECCVQ
jgi:hypothetical protein